MTIDDILVQVLDLLQQEKRVSYRALKRRFELDDDDLLGAFATAPSQQAKTLELRAASSLARL